METKHEKNRTIISTVKINLIHRAIIYQALAYYIHVFDTYKVKSNIHVYERT